MDRRAARGPVRLYYFAYGSNMSLRQMADRCPSAAFMGKGRIDGFRWQINERGVANIVESGGDFVEGLVYQIDLDEKRQLDRSEGVARGFYDDEQLPIRFTPLPNRGLKAFHVARELETNHPLDLPVRGSLSSDYTPQTSISKYQQDDHPNLHVVDAMQVGRPPDQPASRIVGEANPQIVKALVYFSVGYKADGLIRSEYVGRMEKAIADARKLGLSERFLNHVDCIIHQVDHLSRKPEIARPRHNDGYESDGVVVRRQTRHGDDSSHRTRHETSQESRFPGQSIDSPNRMSYDITNDRRGSQWRNESPRRRRSETRRDSQTPERCGEGPYPSRRETSRDSDVLVRYIERRPAQSVLVRGDRGSQRSGRRYKPEYEYIHGARKRRNSDL